MLPTREALHKHKLHGCLKGARYDKIMTVFQECHHNGKWDTLEAEVDKLMTTPETPKELRIVANLESAVSWIFRKKEDKVLHFVCEAKVLSAQVNGDNAIILEGRCEYILSRLYRYLRQFDKAEQHVQKAIYLLHMVEPGEDSAFVHYCNGSIQVERLSDNSTERECRHAQLSYEHAIDHARIHDSGLDLVAPHSFMRLAQMYLGSSHYSAGSQRDSEHIMRASKCLMAVNQSCLAQCSKCHYLLIYSDLQRCQEDIPHAKAIATAQNALAIAQTHNFTPEVTSAQKRLDSL